MARSFGEIAGISEALPSIGALALFVMIAASLAVKQYRTPLD